MARLFIARGVLPRADRLLDGGGVLVEGGRIREVLEGRDEVRERAGRGAVEVMDLGDVVLAPGMVNAHAHMELGWAAGLLSGDEGFAAWVGALVRARRDVAREEEVGGVVSGARRLLETGTTTVGDIDASDAHGRLAAGGLAECGLDLGPRIVRFREVLDAGDETRSAAALERVVAPLEETDLLTEGLSPHAPFTVSPALLRACAQLALERGLPVQVHWAESEEERSWLLRGEGPFAAFMGSSPRKGGLDLLEQAGLLQRRTSLVHANHPEAGDVERVAGAGATVVHCPGTHATFRREPFDWDRWRQAGVPLALGTDSLASNADLDLCREMSMAREAAPGLAPDVLWEAATVGGARALGRERELGAIATGLRADLVAFRLASEVHGLTAQPSDRRRAALEALTTGASSVRAVFLGGRAVFP